MNLQQLMQGDKQYQERMKQQQEEIEQEKKKNPEIAKYFQETDRKNYDSLDFLNEE